MEGTLELADLLHQVAPVWPLGGLLLQLLQLLTLDGADLPVISSSRWRGGWGGWRCRRGRGRGRCWHCLLLLLLEFIIRPVDLRPVDGHEVLGDGDLSLAGGVSRTFCCFLLFFLPLPLILLPLVLTGKMPLKNRRESLSDYRY